jgi:cell division protease FtsH
MTEQRDYSDKIAEGIDEEVHTLVGKAYTSARDLLTAHRARLDRIARYLIEHEAVEGEELARLLEADSAVTPQVAAAPEPEVLGAPAESPADASKAARERPAPGPRPSSGPAPAPAT